MLNINSWTSVQGIDLLLAHEAVILGTVVDDAGQTVANQSQGTRDGE